MNISQKVTIQFSLVAAIFLKKYVQKQENFHVFKMKRNTLNRFKIHIKTKSKCVHMFFKNVLTDFEAI